MPPTDNIGYLIQHVAFTMSRQNDQVLQERLGIGYSQFKILMVLQRTPNIQQRQIADALGQTEASISRQIRIMTDKGLLNSRVSPHNRRIRLTTTTDKGLEITEEATSVLNSYHGAMFNRFSERDSEQLIRTLGAMHEKVCQSGKTGACDRPFSAY
jgi:DNA-binding MarR family transcriptional regulator